MRRELRVKASKMLKRKNEDSDASGRRTRARESPDSYALALPTPETPRFRGSQSPESANLAPPTPGIHIFQRSPSPESAGNREARGIFSNYSGDDQNEDVINRATPEPFSIFTATSNVFSTLKSQIPRLTEDVSLGFSIARTKFLQGGVADDKNYEVRIGRLCSSLTPSKRGFVINGLLMSNGG